MHLIQIKNFARFIESPNVQNKLEALLGDDPADFQFIKNALLAESEFFIKTSALLKQSATNKLKNSNQKLDDALSDGLEQGIEASVDAMTFARILPNAIKIIRNSAIPGTVKVRIADLLTGPPEEVATAIKAIDKIVGSRTGREIRGEKLLSQGTREANKALIREVQNTQKFDEIEPYDTKD